MKLCGRRAVFSNVVLAGESSLIANQRQNASGNVNIDGRYIISSLVSLIYIRYGGTGTMEVPIYLIINSMVWAYYKDPRHTELWYAVPLSGRKYIW